MIHILYMLETVLTRHTKWKLRAKSNSSWQHINNSKHQWCEEMIRHCFRTKLSGWITLRNIHGTHFIYVTNYSNKSVRLLCLETILIWVSSTSTLAQLQLGERNTPCDVVCLEIIPPRVNWFPSSVEEVKLSLYSSLISSPLRKSNPGDV